MKHAATITSGNAAADVKKNQNPVGVIQKIMDDKKAINQFFRGEISINEIDARGIKFVKPV